MAKEVCWLDLKPDPQCLPQPSVQQHWTQVSQQAASLSAQHAQLFLCGTCSWLESWPLPGFSQMGSSPENEMFRILRRLESYKKIIILFFRKEHNAEMFFHPTRVSGTQTCHSQLYHHPPPLFTTNSFPCMSCFQKDSQAYLGTITQGGRGHS